MPAPALLQAFAAKTPAAGGWTPADITGITAWWDASNAGSITSSSGAVSQWNDLSGNGKHATQSTGSNKPTTGTRTINSLNVLDFDAGDWLVCSITGDPSGADRFVMGVVIHDSTGSGVATLFGVNSGTRGFDYRIISDNAPCHDILESNWSHYYTKYAESRSHGTAYILGTQGVGVGTDKSWTNATEWSASFSYSFSSGVTTSTIGAMGGAAPLDGVIGELVVVDGVIADADREDLRDYLNAKWAVY